jgi:hypothetical protein
MKPTKLFFLTLCSCFIFSTPTYATAESKLTQVWNLEFNITGSPTPVQFSSPQLSVDNCVIYRATMIGAHHYSGLARICRAANPINFAGTIDFLDENNGKHMRMMIMRSSGGTCQHLAIQGEYSYDGNVYSYKGNATPC